VRRATKDSIRESARIWLSDPENRKRANELWRKWSKTPEGKASRARRSAMEKFGREIARMVAKPREATCKICGDGFILNTAGRPRRYCDLCVKKFVRSTRTCGNCGKIMPVSKRRLTCRHCGELWGRERDGKV